MPKETDIRGGWKENLGGTLAGWLIRLVGLTIKFEINKPAKLHQPEGRLIHVLWHNQIFIGPCVWRLSYGKRRVVVLTSASKDGATLAATMRVFGLGSVRGSSSRRGVAALIAMKKAAQKGNDLIVTPDGPRGPRYTLQAGVIKLAQTTGLPIIPIQLHYHSCWTLKTWDRFRIPKPFSKVTVNFGDPVEMPKRMDEEEFERQRKSLEDLLKTGITD